MATFAKSSFNTALYAASRPTYPKQLFDFVFRYHQRGIPNIPARWDVALDLGCGTGQATTELTKAPYAFKRIIGVDPSAKMIDIAKEYTESYPMEATMANRFEYVQSSAEDLSFVKDGSVDLMISAQAAHWFDWKKLWPETARVLRSGGSTAFWIYSEFRLSDYPSATPLITEYAQGSDPATSLGPHWQRPGRTILDNHLLDLPDADAIIPGSFTQLERLYFTGEHYPSFPQVQTLPVILRKWMTWDDLHGYFETFSSLHTFRERYPEDSKREDGDIAKRFLNRLKAEVKDASGKDVDGIYVEWPVAMILAKKL